VTVHPSHAPPGAIKLARVLERLTKESGHDLDPRYKALADAEPQAQGADGDTARMPARATVTYGEVAKAVRETLQEQPFRSEDLRIMLHQLDTQGVLNLPVGSSVTFDSGVELRRTEEGAIEVRVPDAEAEVLPTATESSPPPAESDDASGSPRPLWTTQRHRRLIPPDEKLAKKPRALGTERDGPTLPGLG